MPGLEKAVLKIDGRLRARLSPRLVSGFGQVHLEIVGVQLAAVRERQQMAQCRHRIKTPPIDAFRRIGDAFPVVGHFDNQMAV
jgi:hypothetical protein